MISTENVSPVDLVDRERDTVKRDRALGRDEPRQLVRRAQRQPRHVRQVLARGEFGNAIDMAADQVAAEFVAEAKRAFEVELRARLPGPGGGHAQRLRGGIDGKEAAIAVAAHARRRSGKDPSRRSRRRSRSCRDRSRTRWSGGASPSACSSTSITSPKSLTMPVNKVLTFARIGRTISPPDGVALTHRSRGDCVSVGQRQAVERVDAIGAHDLR